MFLFPRTFLHIYPRIRTSCGEGGREGGGEDPAQTQGGNGQMQAREALAGTHMLSARSWSSLSQGQAAA